MRTIGGKKYRWFGKKIRTITYQEIPCVTMPRKDSTIVASAKIDIDSLYKVTVIACNKSGNGKILIGFDGTVVEGIYIVSRDFKEYSVDVCTDNIRGLISNLVISRPNNSSGSVVVKSITYEKIERQKSEEELALEDANEKQKKRLDKQKKIGELQAEKHNAYREKESKKIQEVRGDIVRILGGKGYRWRGKNILSVFKGGTTYVLLKNAGSMILEKAYISPKTVYKVDIKVSGAGALMVNFFGGRKFDGPQVKIKVRSNQVTTHSIEIQSPEFIPTLSMYLRAWIPAGTKGNVCIKSVSYSKLRKKPAPTVPGMPNKLLPKKKPQPKPPFKPEEIYDMKFKPYSNKKVSEKAREVYISNSSQVPLVSIITPTRDGRDLLEKCYNALDKNTAYPNWEWIIGDSDSEDGTADYIKGLEDPRIKLVERGTTDGSFSTINNELTKHANGEYYLFLNDDTEPQNFWLYEMMSKIYNKPSIGVVGARLMYNTKKIQHIGIMFMPEGPGNIGKPMMRSFGGEKFAVQDRFYQAVTGACFLMRAKDFQSVDGFDPIYHFCYEDVDLCLKIKYNLNKKVLYAANAVVMHSESVTQKKFKTGGKLQKEGIAVFKKRWMKRANIDINKYMSNPNLNVYKVDVSFVTCVNDLDQYRKFVVGSLFLNGTRKNYEIIPVLNNKNKYSASQALNIGINEARSNIVVLCHQDVLFYKGWIDMMFERIKEIKIPNWGVLGTAGISIKDKTVGAVYTMKGKMHWRQNVGASVFEVQTVDEHCMIIRKDSGLKFDEKIFSGFHQYGPDICLNALSRNMKNYGILCPIVHESKADSLKSGPKEFMKLLNALSDKWGKMFKHIRTTTSSIRKGKVKTFIKF